MTCGSVAGRFLERETSPQCVYSVLKWFLRSTLPTRINKTDAARQGEKKAALARLLSGRRIQIHLFVVY